MIHHLLFYVILAAGLAPLSAEVNHIIVRYDGTTVVTRIDSMTTDSVFCRTGPGSETEIIPLKTVYYIYNDFNKLYYVSHSYRRHLDLIEHYPGRIITVNRDTLTYAQIQFDRRMHEPTAYITTEADSFYAFPVLNIYRINTTYGFMEESVKKGFLASSTTFLTVTAFKIFMEFLDQRKPGQTFSVLGSAIWHGTEDLLPMLEPAGIKKTGVTYQTLTLVLPLSTIGWMTYDFFTDKTTHYIRPLTAEEGFSKSMKLFSVRGIIHDLIHR